MPTSLSGDRNQLISALPQQARQAILAQCETVDLHFGETLYKTGEPMESVYFPLSGFISLLTEVEGSDPLEMGMIGDEGMLGSALAYNVNSTTMQSVVQGSGTSLRLSATQLRDLLHEFPLLNELLARYLYVLMEQLALSAACTHFHEIEQRLARWLLMSHDRAHSDALELTHKFLASMLGVRRSGVTIAAGKLRDAKLISYSRGHIHVLDRLGLEAISCQCYYKIKQVYAQHLA